MCLAQGFVCRYKTSPSKCDTNDNTTRHTTQHNTTQHNTTQHNTTQHNTTQHNTTQHNTTQHNTTQHNTTQHNTTQHNTQHSTQHSTQHTAHSTQHTAHSKSVRVTCCFDTFDGHLLCLCSFGSSCNFGSTVQHAMERISLIQRARLDPVRARRQEHHAIRSMMRWIRKSCAAACPKCCQTCRKRHVVRDGSEETVSELDMMTGSEQPTDQAKGTVTAGPKAVRLTAPPQLEQIRTASKDAMSAGSPRTVITSLEPEADKLAVLTEEARQIGARIDAARAHEAEESLKERWTMPGDPANQQEKTSSQAALKGQGRRGDDRESCVGISPGRTWTSMLTWFATAYYVRVQQQWDPTLGFPGEG